jgi:SP family sugar:H+ symporter-like MFS transporter
MPSASNLTFQQGIATMVTNQSDRLNLRHTFNTRLTATVLLIAISQFNFGFEQGGFATIQAMDPFEKRFGIYSPHTLTWSLSPKWLSMFNSLPYISFAIGETHSSYLIAILTRTVGIIAGSWISRRFGRRMCMFVMSLWAILGATIIITSETKQQVMAGRILNCMIIISKIDHSANTSLDLYIGMELSVVPVFQSEIVPARVRGFIIGTYQVSLVVSRELKGYFRES